MNHLCTPCVTLEGSFVHVMFAKDQKWNYKTNYIAYENQTRLRLHYILFSNNQLK